MDLQAAVLEPGRAFAAQMVAYFPSLVAAILIVAVGWLLAKFARLLVFRLLLVVRLDMASERAGIDQVLAKADIRQSPAELVAIMVQWLVGLAVLLAAASILGLSPVSELLNHVVLYVPKVIAAVVALILGLFVANVLAGGVRTAAANAGLAETDVLAAATRYAVVAFTVAVTLEELGIAPELVRWAFVIVLGSVCLGLALAFGLGCKDLARDWMVRYLDGARARRKSH
jgi:mechanosensitive ion channel-like protein